MTSSQILSPSKLENIQALRGIAAILVMLSHLFVIEQKYAGDTLLSPKLELGMSGVDLFFVISGFIMVYITQFERTPHQPRKIGKFLFARATRIYPLYWLVSLALLGVWLVRPEIVFSSSDIAPNLLKSFFLWPDVVPPLLQVGWTLVHEVGFYLVFAVILLFKRKYLAPLLLLWAVIMIGAQFTLAPGLKPVSAIAFHPLSLEFIGGAFIGLFYTKLKLSQSIMTILMILIAGLTIACLLYFDHFPDALTRVSSFGVLSLLILTCSLCYERRGIVFPKIIQRIGDWSYALYLTHILTLSVLGRIWAMFAQKSMIDNLIILPLLCVASIGVAALTYYLFERPMIRAAKNIRRKLFG